MPSTQYMGLALPTPGVTVGTWGTTENAAFTLIDSHNHTSGQGVQVPTAGLNINADLPFGGTNAITLRSARFNSQSAVLALTTDIDCVYVSGGDLYYNNASGTAVQITSGGALAASSLGGISGMGGTTASVSYSSISKTFTFLSNTNVGGTIDGGSVVIRSPNTNNGATLQVPTALSANYSLTLLSALPASNLPLSCSSSGTLTAAQITRPQLGSVGEQVSVLLASASQSTVGTLSTTLQVSLTTTGRAVIIMLVASNAGGNVTLDAAVTGNVIYDRDAATSTWVHNYGNIGSGAQTTYPLPPPILDQPSAGAHNYRIKLQNTSGGGAIAINHCWLVAYEL